MAEGVFQRKVCFRWSLWRCCASSTIIRVRNCGGFFVYELGPTPGCNLRCCGEKLPGSSPPPPFTTSPASIPPPICAGSSPPPVSTSPVSPQSSTAVGSTPPPPVTASPASPPPPTAAKCSSANYIVLRERDRNIDYKNYTACDSPFPKRWHRFEGDAGTQMPTKCACVPKFQCGTHAPGWLYDPHPKVAEGAVQRRVCFNWVHGCCHSISYIWVRNWDGFFVYELVEAPKCSSRYCGEKPEGRKNGFLVYPCNVT